MDLHQHPKRRILRIVPLRPPLLLKFNLHFDVPGSRLTFVGSINPKLSPNTERSSNSTTPGKAPLALPAPDIDTFPYEVEEVEEPVIKVKEPAHRF